MGRGGAAARNESPLRDSKISPDDYEQALRMRKKLIMRKTESPATIRLKKAMEYKEHLAFVEKILMAVPDDGLRTIHHVTARCCAPCA